MQFIDSAGIRLHTRVMGDGPLLVMCHGLIAGSMATWFFSAAAELAKRFTVVLYDQRGHGMSDMAPDGYDTETMAQDLSAVIANCLSMSGREPGDDSQEVHLVGFSYGALIALQYALGNQHRVASLSLIDAPLPASRYISPSLDGLNSVQDIAYLHTQMHGANKAGGRTGRRTLERLEYLLLSTLRSDLRMSGDIADHELQALDIPVQCIYGSQSDCKDAATRLSGLLPKVTVDWLDCGHYVVDEAPVEMTRALVRFLRFLRSPQLECA